MAVSPKDKEHFKKLLHNHLSVEEYRKQDHCYISIAGMLAAFCAAKGKFDISVVLENFADFKKSSAYLGGLEKGDTIDWKHLIYYTAAYCFFDIPLLLYKLGNNLQRPCMCLCKSRPLRVYTTSSTAFLFQTSHLSLFQPGGCYMFAARRRTL